MNGQKMARRSAKAAIAAIKAVCGQARKLCRRHGVNYLAALEECPECRLERYRGRSG